MLRSSVVGSPTAGGPADTAQFLSGGAAVHGGVKFYRGAPQAARSYLEADHSRADDYYLAEGTGLAELLVGVNPNAAWSTPGGLVLHSGSLDGDAYEKWVAGLDRNGEPKGRLRTDARGLRFVEVVVNGPKTWSIAAAINPEVALAYDRALDRAANEIVSWLAANSTTRVGPRGSQIQVAVDRIEATVIRHYTSRAGDPHRHLHLQINSRVLAQGAWRGLHSVGVVDSIEAINGMGHAAIACDPQFRRELARMGYTFDSSTGEITELAPFAKSFSQRAGQISRNVDRYEAEWRRGRPGQEPDAKLRRTWDRRAWAEARPDKAAPASGADHARRWHEELRELGFRPPSPSQTGVTVTPIGALRREVIIELVQARLGSRRSAWNAADVRGEVERILAEVNVVCEPSVRRELAEDLTARAVNASVPLLDRDDVPGHVRSLTSAGVLSVESDLVSRLADRSDPSTFAVALESAASAVHLDACQQEVAAALCGRGRLVVVEGAAGAGKTTTLQIAQQVLQGQFRQMCVVTPTLKAAQVVSNETGVRATSAAWVVHQHGFRWDPDGRWSRMPEHQRNPDPRAEIDPGGLLVIDEAGMLDQDTARALMVIADEMDVRVAFVGDRRQLPAVGRGGVLDHALRWAPPEGQVTLETVHRFGDPLYAELTLQMRTSDRAEAVFDALLDSGRIVVHGSEAERRSALAEAGARGERVIAERLETVASLNLAIQDQLHVPGPDRHHELAAIASKGAIYVGDRVATRRNDRRLDVANRDTWTAVSGNGRSGLVVTDGRRTRDLPVGYVRDHVELAYATTVHGAQGETVDCAHFALDEGTTAAAGYVAMTRGRHTNTAHLVADDREAARTQWVDAFHHQRADLGPEAARIQAAEDIDNYGPLSPARRSRQVQPPVSLHRSEVPRGIGR